MPNLLPLNLQLITYNINGYQKLYHNLNIQHELVEDINEKQAEEYYINYQLFPPMSRLNSISKICRASNVLNIFRGHW